MNTIWRSLNLFVLITFVAAVSFEPRQQNPMEPNQALDLLQPEMDEVESLYVLQQPTQQNLYPIKQQDRLQMNGLPYNNRPRIYIRSVPAVNDIYRVPESKRQVRYRQCYFNPISCFRK